MKSVYVSFSGNTRFTPQRGGCRMPNQKAYENSTCDDCSVERWRKGLLSIPFWEWGKTDWMIDTGDWTAESVEVKDLEKVGRTVKVEKPHWQKSKSECATEYPSVLYEESHSR